MKYFIGNKFNSKTFQNKKNNLEQIMLSVGIEKNDNQIDIQSKINEDICRNLISVESIVKKMLKYNTIFLEDEAQNMIGFLIFDINEKDSYLEIHYLCSMKTYKGNGKVLLDKIKEIAKLSNIEQIILTPGPNEKVYKFYQDNGFQEVRLTMIYNIQGGKTKTRKRKRKIRKGKGKGKTRKGRRQ
jgi:GNAT superfamily N-acetyltransferase